MPYWISSKVIYREERYRWMGIWNCWETYGQGMNFRKI